MRILAWIGAVLGALVLLIVVAFLLVDWNALRGPAERLASGFLGRPVAIGNLGVEPGWTTRVELGELRIANPDWSARENLAEVGQLRFSIRIWPLLGGNLDLPRVEMVDASFDFERDEEGRASWDMPLLAEGAADAASPDSRDELPVFGAIEVRDTMLRFVDRRAGLDFNGRIATADAESGEGRQVEIELEGKLGRDRLEVRLVGGPLEMLRQADDPYPLRIDAAIGASRFAADGVVGDPVKLEHVNAAVTLSGPNLAALLPSLELPLPATPPYELSGRVRRDGGVWQVEDLSGRIGDSDIAGELTVTVDSEKPEIRGELASNRLVFADLAPLIGLSADSAGRSGTAGTDASVRRARKGFFPQARLDREPFHTANVDLSFAAKEVISPPAIPVTAISAHVLLRDGRLLLDSFEVEAAGGTIAGEIAVNARTQLPSVDADLGFNKLDLRQFFRDTAFIQEMGGRFHGDLYLVGSGFSLAELFSTADGKVSLAMNDGSISGLVVEGIGLDLMEALLMVVSSDARVAIRCGRIDLVARKGRMEIDRALIDTSDSLLVAGGAADLANETLDLQVEARAKDFSLIDMAAPVEVSGPMRDPSIGIGGLDPLPFFELGDQEDIDCAALGIRNGVSGEPVQAGR